jgi:polyisoprenoid-binding protein YceI
MKKTLILLALILTTGAVFAQKKTTTSATVTFDATTEKDALPKAENKTVIAAIDTKTGTVAFEAAVKNFTFGNPRMQAHFNGSEWLNSDTYPSITFTGKIEKMKDVNFTKDGEYKVKVSGILKVKDISQEQKVDGLVIVTGGKISVSTLFSVKLEDYKISGQPVDAGKVAKEPRVTVNADFL